MYFNNKDRRINIFKSSLVSTICSALNIILGFVYRTIFLYYLSAEYLGINGLFTNVLSLLSLAELGITSAITYRFYQPIKDENIEKVGELMNFFRSIYKMIMIVIIGLGLILLPFINQLIADPSEIPSDVNLNIVYVLFLMQTASTYIFSYKQTMLTIDQNQHIFSICQSCIVILKYISQVVVLILLKNYTASLMLGISVTIIFNALVSAWVTRKYKAVFNIKNGLSKEEKREIFKDTKASMYHKIGGTILTSTDNIILTKFVSLAVTGIYSNYSLIMTSLTTLLNQVFCSFTASIGNAFVDLPRNRFYEMYRRMINLNFWIVGLVTSLLYLLVDDFMKIWLGENYVLDSVTVAVLAIQFYLEMIRLISISFVNATGLFVKDKMRPLIEATVNLVVSIIAVKTCGIPGVFIGTIVSHIVTVTWREPYLLYKCVFQTTVGDYWKCFFKYSLLSVLFIACFRIAFDFRFHVYNIFIWILKGASIALVYLIVSIVVNWKNDIFKYYWKVISERMCK